MATVRPGTNLRAAISERELQELYVTQGLTIEQVAARFGVATTTISRRFSELGIRARRRGPVPAGHGDLPEAGREWTPALAYAVGMIASDGCLSGDGRHLSVTSKDLDLLETIKQCLRVTARITPAFASGCYRVQWGDVVMWQWLCDIGLMPAKSLRLGPLRVPDVCFPDFLRGCIDGDGSIITYVDRYNTFKSPRYVYTRLYLSLVSASRAFIEYTHVCSASRRRVGRSQRASLREGQ